MNNELSAALMVTTAIAFAVVAGVLLSSPSNDNTSPPVTHTQPALAMSESNVENITAIPQDTVVNTPTASISQTAAMFDSIEFTEQPPIQTTDRLFSATPSPMPSIVPSSTATSTSTATMTITPTPTYTSTSVPSPSRTPMPEETSGILPTSTATLSPLTIISLTPSTCSGLSGWVGYVVAPGNTLFSIARATGTSVPELLAVNCLDNASRIFVGDIIFVPQLPTSLLQAPNMSSSHSDSQVENVLGCRNPGVNIQSPLANSTVTGLITIIGSAIWPEFGYFKIEVRLDGASTYNFISRQDIPIPSGHLGVVDSSLFGAGLHWIRLTVVDATGNIPDGATCVIPLIFE